MEEWIMTAARWVAASIVACAVLLGSTAAVRGQEAKRPWSDTAEFSFISTTGNTENTNLAFTNKYVYTWSNADFTFDAAALRVESTTRTVTSDGTAISVQETSTTSAATYGLAGKYRRDITEKFFWYGRAAWLRDEPAGIDSRTSAGGGLGYRFLKSDLQNLAVEFGVNYTDEEQVGGASESFAEARAFVGYDRALSATSKFVAELELLDNLDTTSDWRANFVTSVTASLTAKLAVKVGYRVRYDNEPVQDTIADTVPPLGGPDLVFTHDETDTIFSASLVVNF
jgi:putative salt-induced outer membrane protein